MPIGREVIISHRDLVREKYPGAYEHDDGEWIYIRVPRPITEPCPTCGQQRTYRVEALEPRLGSGGSPASAWRNAAEKLGLIWNTN